MQEKYLELQMADQQIKQIQQQLQLIQQQMTDLDSLKENLDEFRDVKPGTEILVPFANGIFAKAELKDSKELLINVGGNTTVSKTVGGTKEMLDAQMDEMVKIHEKLALDMQKIAAKAKDAELEVNNLVEKSKE